MKLMRKKHLRFVLCCTLMRRMKHGWILCRNGPSYDFVFGPVADDDVYTTFALYTAGVLSKEQTVELLKVKKLYNQLVLTTNKALQCLKFVGTVPKEEV